MRDEKEYKLKPLANHQIKFQAIGDAYRVSKIIDAILGVLDIKYEKPTSSKFDYTHIDTYFDSNNFFFLKHDYSLRVREYFHARQKNLTFKAPKATEKINDFQKLVREEIQDSVADEVQFPDKVLFSDVKDHLSSSPNISYEGYVYKKLKVITKRMKYKMEVSGTNADLSYDIFYYCDLLTHSYSEYFQEIEIEVTDGNPNDGKIIKLCNLLETLFEFENNPTSKYKQGMDWVLNKESQTKTIRFLGVDIIASSLLPDIIQKQAILLINKVVKDSIRENNIHTSSEPIYISTGDGMIVGFSDDFRDYTIVIKDIERKMNENNFIDGYGIKYRIALHRGPVFKHTDVNNSISVSGSGINVTARLLEYGGDRQVIMSKQFVEACREEVKNSGVIRCDGTVQVKHGVKIDLYNYYKDKEFGNIKKII